MAEWYFVISSLIKKVTVDSLLHDSRQKSFPILFRMIEKIVEIHIIHKCNSHHGCKAGKSPGTSQPLFHY